MLHLCKVDLHCVDMENDLGGCQIIFVKDKKSLSYYKAFKTMLRVKLTELRDILFCGIGNISQFMINFYNISKIKHLLEIKRKEPTSTQIL